MSPGSGGYTKKVIYCGMENIVVLPTHCTTINCIQRRNKVAGQLMIGLVTMSQVCKVF
jgi:hypothetical protein